MLKNVFGFGAMHTVIMIKYFLHMLFGMGWGAQYGCVCIYVMTAPEDGK